jgi:hypothetical protein
MGTYPEQILYLCQRTLQAVAYGFARAGVALPDRQLVFGGTQLPYDPDNPDEDDPGMLAVGLALIGQGKPGNPQSAEQIPPLSWRYATLQIELWRPASGLTMQVQLPDDATIEADAQTFLDDAAVLLGALEDARGAGRGAPNWIVGPHTPFAISWIRPAAVSGGTSGTIAQIACALSGDP